MPKSKVTKAEVFTAKELEADSTNLKAATMLQLRQAEEILSSMPVPYAADKQKLRDSFFFLLETFQSFCGRREWIIYREAIRSLYLLLFSFEHYGSLERSEARQLCNQWIETQRTAKYWVKKTILLLEEELKA